ncbi:hypothetical protein PanWU01x14_061560 [Parasponia andersonii]|uniref:Uncharacterized protein n=1 Tax=Parasponia andersonii TaxID=3476 RepID=A0A2P5DI87_PARAD|nr:hypothetical protein PanWU01x14_061560 [Parasponia andersonii]
MQAAESKCSVRSCIKIPTTLGPPPSIGDWGCIPSVEQLELSSQDVCSYTEPVYCINIRPDSYPVFEV